MSNPQRTEFKIVKQVYAGTEETNDRFFINAYDDDGDHVGYLQKNGTISFGNFNGWFDDYSEIGIAMIKHKAVVDRHQEITVVIKGGMCVDVRGLPEGWVYAIEDYDVEQQG